MAVCYVSLGVRDFFSSFFALLSWSWVRPFTELSFLQGNAGPLARMSYKRFRSFTESYRMDNSYAGSFELNDDDEDVLGVWCLACLYRSCSLGSSQLTQAGLIFHRLFWVKKYLLRSMDFTSLADFILTNAQFEYIRIDSTWPSLENSASRVFQLVPVRNRETFST